MKMLRALSQVAGGLAIQSDANGSGKAPCGLERMEMPGILIETPLPG